MKKFRDYLGLWGVMTVALLVIVVVSWADGVSILGFDLKPAPIVERLTRNPAKADVGAGVALKHLSMRQAESRADTASHRILIFGDSMLEGLNRRLGAYAKANGHTLNSVIWYSSTTKTWAECDTLRHFLKRFNPTYVFISLGGNELFVRGILESRDGYVKKIIRELGDIPYVWIGPPNWKEDTGINELIAKNVPPGRFFVSNGMKFDRQKDGAHPTYESAAVWFDSIARWMPLHSDHPIRMKRPESTVSGRPATVVVLQPPTN
ncbi:MAG: SGNH/GDSL hydrolase family protein [Paramuribaculum sp.]|nr:SGNH/GDSL hydrolase family protein [Paramuribaculum sp.]